MDGAGSWNPVLEADVKAPIWDGNRYVAFSYNTKYSSIDLKSWEKSEISPLPELPTEVSFNNNQFIAHVEYQKNFSSKDGVAWVPLYPNSRTINMIFWMGKLYGSADNLPLVRIYDDPEWATVFRPKLGPHPADNGLIATSDYLFAFGSHISWSKNGRHWGSYVLQSSNEVERIIEGNGKYIAIGTGDLVLLGVPEK